MSVKTCTSCKKQVYPVEEFKFSDHLFHKGCFRCTTCNLQLNIKNGKLSDGKPYCATHYPTVHSFAVVSDTPEIQRVQKNMAIASQTQYKGQQDKKAEQERRRANMENPPAVPTKPTRQVGSIADFDPVAAEKAAHRGPPAGAASAAAAASGTVVYSSTSTPAPAAATPTPVPPAAAADGAATTKSGYGRSGYGRSGATPAATGTTGQRSSAIDAPAAAPAASTVTEVQSVASRPTSVQQPTPTPVVPATSTPPPTLAAAQPPAPPPEPAPQPLPAGAGVRVSNQEVSSLSQDVGVRLSLGTSGDRASLQAAAPVAEPAAPTPTPTPAPAAQPPAATSEQTYIAIYDYDATDDDEVSIQVGDIMTKPEQIDEGWMYATNQRTGKRGMLPSNYVEFVKQ